MSIEGQGHFFTIYFPGFVCFVLYLAKISGERLQDHWSSGSCCHQTWFRKSVSVLKNTHIPAESKRLHCTEFTSVGNEEWICHTCLRALRDSKVPKLSVANGMKWPDKPPELNLHQLEERLIALRIPFMQIRELPRGGQYSLKGNVINVPVSQGQWMKILLLPSS